MFCCLNASWCVSDPLVSDQRIHCDKFADVSSTHWHKVASHQTSTKLPCCDRLTWNVLLQIVDFVVQPNVAQREKSDSSHRLVGLKVNPMSNDYQNTHCKVWLRESSQWSRIVIWTWQMSQCSFLNQPYLSPLVFSTELSPPPALSNTPVLLWEHPTYLPR